MAVLPSADSATELPCWATGTAESAPLPQPRLRSPQSAQIDLPSLMAQLSNPIRAVPADRGCMSIRSNC
jgi:hypothetical protein